MQTSARQQELERLFNSRKGHNPHISISDDSHHITEAIGSYYGSEQDSGSLAVENDHRPLSYMSAPSEARFTAMPRSTSLSNRHAGHYDGGERPPMPTRASSDKVPGLVVSDADGSASNYKRLSGLDDLNTSPTGMSAQDTAVQSFPLNDIDYESSPAAVAQELSNLQAIRRMSMNVDMADPDLPSFGSLNAVPGPPGSSTDDDDPSKLFWVPARLHPELAPKEFKTFVEERADKIRRRSGSGSEDSLSPEAMERSPSGAADLRRKKSMLSHSIDTRGNYEDGAERLERKRSKGMHIEGATKIASLQDLEQLVTDPVQLMRRMSLDNQRRSEDSGGETPTEDDVIMPGMQQGLKRSIRTTYRRGSLRKGERVPFSKRALNRYGEHDPERRMSQDDSDSLDSPIQGLSRVQTEPIPEIPGREERNRALQRSQQGPYQGEIQHEPQQRHETQEYASFNFSDESPTQYHDNDHYSQQQYAQEEQHHYSHHEHSYHQESYQEQPQYTQQKDEPLPPVPQAPQPRQFQSRIASQGRTTAQLPGYNNTNPLPSVIETLPDGTKVPAGPLIGQAGQFPERKSSIESARPQRGAHSRPVPGRTPAQTLDDITSNPSLMPGSGATRTNDLTMIPTFEEKKSEKKDIGRKSSWKWILGNDDDDKKKKQDDSSSLKSSKSGKLSKSEKARLDLLQSSIDGNTSARPRESLVLNREDIKIEDERKTKKSFDSSRKEPKEPSLLATIFGSKKKTSDTDVKEKKRKHDRNLSPEAPPRLLKADIDYNWTRFSILEERAIYRMAHIKLANPRRALYSQVLLSNFMYSYLAKVQMMHPQMQIPQQPNSKQQQAQQEQQRQQQQQQAREAQASQERDQQRWQEQQQHEAAQQSMQHHEEYHGQTERGYEDDQHYEGQHDRNEWPEYRGDEQHYGQPQTNGGHRGDGYNVASGHDYRGYNKDQRGYSNDRMWEDEESEELW